jgi:hypothetical protein
MIEREIAELPVEMGQASVRHILVDQLTIAKGWTQIVASYPPEEWLRREEIVRKGLARIDAATAHMTELLGQVASSSSCSPPGPPHPSGPGSPPPRVTH